MSAADGGWEALVGARLEGGRIEEEGKGRGVSGPSPSSRAWDGRLLGAGCSRIGTTSRDCPLRSTMIKHDQARRGGKDLSVAGVPRTPFSGQPGQSISNTVQSYPIQSSPVPAQLSPAQPKPDGRTCSVSV